jgi:subtilisin family serine protease
MKTLFRSFALCVLAASAVLPNTAAWAQPAEPALIPAQTPSKPIRDRYIVVFKADVADPQGLADALLRGVANGRLHHVYRGAIKGFAATLPAQALEAISRNPNVDYIEQDATVELRQSSVQNSATWGLDRIDQADRPLDTQYRFNQAGSGVHAFIIDTGLRADHVEFTGRVLPGYGVVADGQGTNDCNGHGTHVAGTVGGSTWGVAKQVRLVPVRVLDCAGSGSFSGVIAGIDWAASSTLRPAVANLSLGGGLSSSVNQAVAGAVAKGVVMVVAAGNENVDACTRSPASEPSAITVGATTSADQRASYSNFGSCVDLFAPGSSITSAWNSSSTAGNTISGTSMAAPHVAGAAALVLQTSPSATPAAVAQAIRSQATSNRLSSLGTGSPNLLLYSLLSGAPTLETQVVAVRSLSGSSASARGGWVASVVASVRNVNTLAAVANVTVKASFTPGSAVSCVTAATGSCTLRSGTFGKSVASTTLAVTGLSGTQMVYDASQNLATRVTVGRP